MVGSTALSLFANAASVYFGKLNVIPKPAIRYRSDFLILSGASIILFLVAF
jgi:hypothetical protein